MWELVSVLLWLTLLAGCLAYVAHPRDAAVLLKRGLAILVPSILGPSLFVALVQMLSIKAVLLTIAVVLATFWALRAFRNFIE